MNIGIVGSGERARAIGKLLAGGGHRVTFGDADLERARQAAALSGAPAQTPYRQAMTADLLLLAVSPSEIDRAIRAIGSGAEVVIVDATGGRPSGTAPPTAERIAHALDTHRVVRAVIGGTERGALIPICGDDPSSKALVAQALQACGCSVADLGPLSKAASLSRS